MCGKSDSQISLKAPAFAPRGGGGAEARADEEALAAAGAEVGPSAAEGPEAGGASHPPAQLWRPRFQSADL
jgi:hypothetical protein